MSDRINRDRKKRVRILKRMLLSCFLAAVLIPTALSICLGVRVHSLKQQIAELEAEARDREQKEAVLSEEDSMQAEAEEQTEEDSIRAWEEQERELPVQQHRKDGIRKVYLTFDDGPSIYTDDILDILKQYDVKATFFVVGKGKGAYEDAYRRIVEEGHTLGMHSYSHAYGEVYASKEAFIQDVNKLQDYLHEVTEVYPDVYRFPGGSSNQVSTVDMQELKAYLDEIGVTWYDWNISSGDATGHLSKDRIVENATRNLENYHEAVILFHDAADKKTTLQALPEIIERILAMEDTVIVPITETTVPIQHGR